MGQAVRQGFLTAFLLFAAMTSVASWSCGGLAGVGLALTEVMASRVVRTVKEINDDEKYIFQSAVGFNRDSCSL